MDKVNITKKLFGGEISFFVYDIEENIAKDLIEETYLEGLRLQKIFNFFDKNSVLSLLNKKRKLKVPAEFLEVLNRALKMCKETNGLYDISLGKQFIQRKRGEVVKRVNCSYNDIKVNEDSVELLNPDVMIDFGSIAKGYITDKMAEFLESKGVISEMIDSRGDIIIFGDKEFKLEIQHPRDKNKSIGSLKIKNKGVATSGDYNQYDTTFDKSHIINQNEYISVTVIAPTLMEADLYATAIFVTPKNKVKYLLSNKKDIRVFCVDNELKVDEHNCFL